MSKPFGEGIWKDVQAIRFAKDDSLEAPVRADGEHGIRVGLDAVAAQPENQAGNQPDQPAPRPRRRLRDLVRGHRRS